MAKKTKLPKRIAGVKIPKAIRKGPVGDFLNSSAGQMVIAEALVLAGAVFTARRTDPDSTTSHLARHPLEGLREALGGSDRWSRETIRDGSARLSYACAEALKAFRAALREGSGDSLSGASGAGEMAPEVEPAKKKSGSRPETPSTPH